MDLYIRSQDKTDLSKINMLKIREHVFENGEKEYFILNNNSMSDVVGIYKTKERALEVLGEIQRKIKFMYIFENYKLQKNSCIEQDLIGTDFNIYEMPQD
ncbi:MAG: hypothetical protein ACI4VE_05735 [Clostridia bacterium]